MFHVLIIFGNKVSCTPIHFRGEDLELRTLMSFDKVDVDETPSFRRRGSIC